MSHPESNQDPGLPEKADSSEYMEALAKDEATKLERIIDWTMANQDDPSFPDYVDEDEDPDDEPLSPETLELHRIKAELIANEPAYTLEEMREQIRRNHQQLLDRLDEDVEYSVQEQNPETPEEAERLRERYRKILHPGPVPTYDDEEDGQSTGS